MQKGYSKEVMEALFKQEEQRVAKEAEKKSKQNTLYKQEALIALVEKIQDQMDKQQKKIKWLKIGLIINSVLTFIALAMAFNTALKEFLLLLP